jgi:hypothetical protein
VAQGRRGPAAGMAASSRQGSRPAEPDQEPAHATGRGCRSSGARGAAPGGAPDSALPLPLPPLALQVHPFFQHQGSSSMSSGMASPNAPASPRASGGGGVAGSPVPAHSPRPVVPGAKVPDEVGAARDPLPCSGCGPRPPRHAPPLAGTRRHALAALATRRAALPAGAADHVQARQHAARGAGRAGGQPRAPRLRGGAGGRGHGLGEAAGRGHAHRRAAPRGGRRGGAPGGAGQVHVLAAGACCEGGGRRAVGACAGRVVPRRPGVWAAVCVWMGWWAGPSGDLHGSRRRTEERVLSILCTGVVNGFDRQLRGRPRLCAVIRRCSKPIRDFARNIQRAGGVQRRRQLASCEETRLVEAASGGRITPMALDRSAAAVRIQVLIMLSLHPSPHGPRGAA